MECNKEEASRAKLIAEKKFEKRDIAGAKRFALKAQSLYPDLVGLSHFLATLDVYIASEQTTNGETNWYGVLGVEPSASVAVIRRSYKNLALILHPDKNNSVGADGAFKILSEALDLLTDKPRRRAYDQKRYSSNDTFWTLCNLCKIQFEYSRLYVISELVCPICHQPFLAVEVPAPLINGDGRTWTASAQGNNSKQHVAGESTSNSNMRLEVNLGAFREADTAGRMSVGAPTSGSAKRPFPADFVSVPAVDRLKKKRCTDEHRRNNPSPQMPSRNGGVGDSGARKGSFETGKRNRFGKFKQTRELSQQELRNLLIEIAKKDIQLKLNDWKIPPVGSKTSEKEMGKGKQKIADTDSGAQLEPLVTKLDDGPDRKVPDPVSMPVPDSDFHDFDKERTVMSFGPNQVWAAYDGDDGMPRTYAMIHYVISLKPLKMRISWLNTKSNHELAPLNWIGSGFLKTSGIFSIGKREDSDSLNCFSHKVKWEKGKRGIVTIYPRKGDVWGMYTHWSPDWDAETLDVLIHNYSMVEVLEDYSEEEGVAVAPLIKVAGFKTVFSRHPDSSITMTIPKAELFRLSHQVPFHVLTGNEGHNVPKGCLELDPASIPEDLLQIFTEVEVKEMVESAAKNNILPVNGGKSELQWMEDGEIANDNDWLETAVKKIEAEIENFMVYKRKQEEI
ncbi:DNAJ heat shock N-terminal domain-containing protein [Euphorbia peplus]|nr:DNAJ heat shock N-terminal domain-containing protein [Euphorbia peplus]